MSVVVTVVVVVVAIGFLIFIAGDPPRGHRPRPSSTPLDRPAPPPGPGSTSRQETTVANHRHRSGLSAPTLETVDLMLAQVGRDRAQSSYWQSAEHRDTLDAAESWLLSLRDWLGARP